MAAHNNDAYQEIHKSALFDEINELMLQNFDARLCSEHPRQSYQQYKESVRITKKEFEKSFGKPKTLPIQKCYQRRAGNFREYMAFQNPYMKITTNYIKLIFPRKKPNKFYFNQMLEFIKNPNITPEQQSAFDSLDDFFKFIVTSSDFLVFKMQSGFATFLTPNNPGLHLNHRLGLKPDKRLLNIVCVDDKIFYVTEKYPVKSANGEVYIEQVDDREQLKKHLLTEAIIPINSEKYIPCIKEYLDRFKDKSGIEYMVNFNKTTIRPRTFELDPGFFNGGLQFRAYIKFDEPLSLECYSTLNYSMLQIVRALENITATMDWFVSTDSLKVEYGFYSEKISITFASKLVKPEAIVAELQKQYPSAIVSGDTISFDIESLPTRIYHEIILALSKQNIIYIYSSQFSHDSKYISNNTIALYFNKPRLSNELLNNILEKLKPFDESKLVDFKIIQEDKDHKIADLDDTAKQAIAKIEEIVSKNKADRVKPVSAAKRPGLG